MAGLFVLCLALLASRRWGQLVAPQVWDEESSVIKGFIDHGWLELLHPTNGYLILVPKFVIGVSMAISLLHLPAIATAFAWVLTASVGVAVAISPTRLKGKALCALAVFAVPSDPEVFGIPLYTFWWLSLLLFLHAVWDEERPALGWRMVFLLAGGLSSPVIVALLPVLLFRAWWFRKVQAETWLAVAATAVAATQFHFMNHGQAAHFPSVASIATHTTPKFFGAFLFGNLSASLTLAWISGLCVLGVIVAGVVRDRRNVFAWILLFLLLAAVALSVTRVNPAALHPRLAGPRYFFYPFVMISWVVIQCGFRPQRIPVRILVGVMIVLAGVNAVPVWTRAVKQDDLRWADHLRSAPLFPEYTVPNQFDGSQRRPWRFLRNTGVGWARVIGRPQFFPAGAQESLPTFAYRILDAGGWALGGPGITVTLPKDSKPIPSVVSPKTGRREIVLQVNRGDRFYFRSGPGTTPARMSVAGSEGLFIEEMPLTSGWVILEFSNARLPPSFTLKIEDAGDGVGDWAVAGSSG